MFCRCVWSPFFISISSKSVDVSPACNFSKWVTYIYWHLSHSIPAQMSSPRVLDSKYQAVLEEIEDHKDKMVRTDMYRDTWLWARLHALIPAIHCNLCIEHLCARRTFTCCISFWARRTFTCCISFWAKMVRTLWWFLHLFQKGAFSKSQVMQEKLDDLKRFVFVPSLVWFQSVERRKDIDTLCFDV